MTISRRKRPGFTLFEMVLVMAIIVVLGSVAVVSLEGQRGDTRIRGAADEVRSAWADCRTRAIDEGVPYTFSVKSGTTKYKLAPVSGQMANTSQNGTVQHNSAPTEGDLPDKILFNAPGGDEWTVVATFLPDGTVKPLDNSTEDPHIDLNETGSLLILTVSVRPLTGIVSVKSNKQKE